MFSKICLYVLLLACVYTYMLKPIENDVATNFQKKPNLKNFVTADVFRDFLGIILGDGLLSKIKKDDLILNNLLKFFYYDVLPNVRKCKNSTEQKEVYDKYITPKIKLDVNAEEQKKIEEQVTKHQEEIKNENAFKTMIDKLEGHIDTVETMQGWRFSQA